MTGKRFLSTIILIALLLPSTASARYFDPNDIFTDAELFDSSALSRTAIQQFLESKNSVLATVTDVVDGMPKLVSEMIYELGKRYTVSQKFLLAKLQHEQGLVEKTSATENAIDWATGYSCFNRRCNEKYRGIYEQLDAAADVQRIYAQRSQSSGYFGYEVGKQSTTADGFTVTPANQATTNLYIYTPYQGGKTGIGGNYAFWRVWNRYFTERTFADGALLRDSVTGEYWKIEQNKKRKFASADIYLKDNRPEDAIEVTGSQLSYYSNGSPITFGNNTVVRGESSSLMYLLSDGSKYRIVGSNALATLGYRLADTEAIAPVGIADEILENLPEGEPITEQSVYPQGVLVGDGTGAMYYLKNGVRYALIDEAVWQENFGNKSPLLLDAETLASYPVGEPLKLDDGSIVKSQSGTYYIIANGDKHPVANPSIVQREYGDTRFNSIKIASSQVLAMHDTADTIDYINDTIQDPPNYVSYAERVGANVTQNTAPSTTAASTYLTLYDSVKAPETMLAGTPNSATVTFRNRGTASWQAGSVYLKLIDENSDASSFRAENRVALAKNTDPGQIAEFTFAMIAPLEGGIINEWFILEYTNGSGSIVEMRGGLVNKEISVVSGISGVITNHNLPVALKNSWKPYTVTMKIKNTSTDEVWTSRRAALSIHAPEGEKSPFYDPHDWIDTDVAGVPLNKSTIAPGEEGVLKFTIDPRGVKPGIYTMVFSMELRDADETVYLNGAEQWERLIRIDR